MEPEISIPDVVIKRLPIYARALTGMLDAGSEIVSSTELALATGSTAAQIRRDLSYFGEFGKQGRGYDIHHLLDEIRGILNINERYQVVVVGAGPLGQAITRYGGFSEHGFPLSWVYDHNPERVGTMLNDVLVEDVATMPERIRTMHVRVAIIAVPAAAAQEVADVLVASGIKAILNYAPTVLRVPGDVRVNDIDPVAALQALTYYLSPAPSRLRRT
ncbi:MAG: redox-sensing transcriptional repressor Rex [Chloroflexota bacterium]|nr:redox-sensing transcriptional repressor Rex [Chloroflexota bacterium]